MNVVAAIALGISIGCIFGIKAHEQRLNEAETALYCVSDGGRPNMQIGHVGECDYDMPARPAPSVILDNRIYRDQP